MGQEMTPMMVQYLETKEAYKDCILFYRLGDFYEMFFDDAITASRELELTLTGKSCGLDERAPMCGVPYHAVDTYLSRLIAKGYKVAICEQVEDPKTAKGIVKREVIRIVTPGTNMDVGAMEESRNNYLMSILYSDDRIGISAADITTGDFFVTETEDSVKLLDEIYKYSPKEIICNEAFLYSVIDVEEIKKRLNVYINPLNETYFDEAVCMRTLLKKFHATHPGALGLADFSLGSIAAGTILLYLKETQKSDMPNLLSINPYLSGKYMLLDSASRRNLELTETLREKQKIGSLIWVLDKTKTAMGSRALRQIIEQPLIDLEMIEKRQDAIEEISNDPVSRDEIREYLNAVYDLERLMGKVSYLSVNPRDMIALKNSFMMLSPIKALLRDFESDELRKIYEDIDPMLDFCELLDDAFVEDPPISIREAGFIKEGYNSDIDMLRHAKTDGKQWLAALEEEDRERTGIKNLKIKYNKVFGYYYEITNSFKDLVPADYIRKQTLVNAERYTNPKLKELEDSILNAEDKLNTLEYDAFCEIRDRIQAAAESIHRISKAIALLDVYCSLSLVAERNHYVRPKMNVKGIIDIKDGRHPVVEKMIDHDLFISNDTYLDNNNHSVSIITGPNMAGKSTYMRQVALIVLMAQIGSFVPAKKANIGIVDRIFTRVGASDDLASGQSTFMVEMNEVANILRNATKDSLLILDEIGRGTSTFDGLSIAWAVIEHISNRRYLGAKTLFATHYHELTQLEGKMSNVDNYCIAVKENGDDIVFLRKIIKGGADKSYGIEVAKLAGVPDIIIKRAKEICEEISNNDITEKVQLLAKDTNAEKHTKQKQPDELDLTQISLFDTVSDEDVLNELMNADISNMTPLDALNTLSSLQNRLKNRWHV